LTHRVDDKHSTGWPTVRRLFDFEQAADFCGVPVEEIWRRIRSGELRVYHLGNGRIRIDEADLLASSEPRELKWQGPWQRQREAWRSN
jgi:hypothetical protein